MCPPLHAAAALTALLGTGADCCLLLYISMERMKLPYGMKLFQTDARRRNVRDDNEQYDNDNDDYENDDHDSDKTSPINKKKT